MSDYCYHRHFGRGCSWGRRRSTRLEFWHSYRHRFGSISRVSDPETPRSPRWTTTRYVCISNIFISIQTNKLMATHLIPQRSARIYRSGNDQKLWRKHCGSRRLCEKEPHVHEFTEANHCASKEPYSPPLPFVPLDMVDECEDNIPARPSKVISLMNPMTPNYSGQSLRISSKLSNSWPWVPKTWNWLGKTMSQKFPIF